MKKIKIFAVVFAFLMLIVIFFSYAIAPVATGYSAKYLCSSVYVNKMNSDKVWSDYIIPENPIFKLVDYEINEKNRTIEVSLYGLFFSSKAKYFDGCGCVLLKDKLDNYENHNVNNPKVLDKNNNDNFEWPKGKEVVKLFGSDKIKQKKIQNRIEKEFYEIKGKPKKNTWGIAVVYKDKLWAEHYMDGINKNTPLLSWSASKSITSTLVGRWFTLSGESWNDSVKLPLSKERDYNYLKWKDLLQMQGGLDFDETYKPFSDVTKMLYDSDNIAIFASDKEQKYVPGKKWMYSSGTTNIISWLLKERLGGSKERFENFSRTEFLNLLGIKEAVFEYDNSGTFIGSSYFHASPQSWLKIGMLYKNKGNWNGKQILSKDWVDFALSPASDSKGKYGAQIWLNQKVSNREKIFPKLPDDTFMFQGYQGQFIVVIPSIDFIIVRMGVMRDPNWKIEDLILDLLKIINK